MAAGWGGRVLLIGSHFEKGYRSGVNFDWRHYAPAKAHPYWRGARIAARILRKSEKGQALSPRDRRVARELVRHHGVNDRLIDQAMACLKAPLKV